MDGPGSHASADIFRSIGVVQTDELINCLNDDIEIVQPDEKLLAAEFPDNIKFEADVIKKTQAKVSIEYINNLLGYGVVAQEPIAEGAMVGEYTGKLYSYSQISYRSLPDLRFIMEVGPFGVDKYGMFYELFIDAKDKGNFTRFINHSYKPNLSEKIVFAKGLWHIVLIANQRIDQNAQLSINYGEGYWQVRNSEPIDL